jgi:flagellar biosynthesis component FlhA
MLWAIHAALVEFGKHDDSLTKTQRDQLTAVVERLPFSHVYRLGRGDLSVRTAAPLIVLEVLLGANHHDLADSPALNRGIPDLRDQIAREMGVRIQGVRVSVSDDIDPHRVEFRLFGEGIGHVFLTPGTRNRERPVLERLEKRLRERLYRLIGPDDINLWLEDWAPGSTSARTEVLSYSRDRRLALARMLRMLLREGVPISDRDTLLKTFQECDRSSDPLALLRAVRIRLGAEHAALSPPPQRFPLPKRIEDRIRGGLAESGDRWELDRAETTSVVRVLREWLADLPAVRKSIVVADPQTRPFIWRLLAAEPQPVRVFSEEEQV